MSFHGINTDAWNIIVANLPIVDTVRLASSCRWLYSRFANRSAEWRELFETLVCKNCREDGKKNRYCALCSRAKINSTLARAAGIGDLGLVKVFARQATCGLWALYTASRYDHIEILYYLTSRTDILPASEEYILPFVTHGAIIRGCVIDYGTRKEILFLAVQEGDLEAIRTIPNWFRNFEDYNQLKALKIAAENGHMHILEWVYYNFTDSLRNMVRFAAPHALIGGHIHILEWLYDRELKPSRRFLTILYAYQILYYAVQSECISALKFVENVFAEPLGNYFTRDQKINICICAIRNYNNYIFIWLLKNNCVVAKSRLRQFARRHGFTPYLL
jgi:hypothetical protein